MAGTDEEARILPKLDGLRPVGNEKDGVTDCAGAVQRMRNSERHCDNPIYCDTGNAACTVTSSYGVTLFRKLA